MVVNLIIEGKSISFLDKFHAVYDKKVDELREIKATVVLRLKPKTIHIIITRGKGKVLPSASCRVNYDNNDITITIL